ncbi:MAG: hypothetical protein KBT20_01260 [Bacteroidales bacterium]|nr:hypothetical protein [Candidatus Liminaster caballi]
MAQETQSFLPFVTETNEKRVTFCPRRMESGRKQCFWGEIQAISLERLNNGAHYLIISNVLARVEADTKVASKAGSQFATLRAAKEQEDIDLKMQLDKQTGLLIVFLLVFLRH